MDEALLRRNVARRRLITFATLLTVCSLATACGGKSGDGVGTAATKTRNKPDLQGQPLPPLTKFIPGPGGTVSATISSDFLFGLDDATVSPKAEKRIRKDLVPEILKRLRNTDARLSIEGYADGLGTAAHNLALSRRRAAAVKQILVGAAVPAAQMMSRGFGEQGAVDNRANPSRRKVVLVISGAPA